MRDVDIPDELDRFIEEQLSTRAYGDADDVVSAGLRLLQRRADRDLARTLRLQMAVEVGLDDVRRGDVEEVSDLDAYFRDLEAEVEAEFK